MTDSSSTTENHTSAHDEAAARAEALAWIGSQLFWERRLREFVEAKAVAHATADITLPAAVAMMAAMDQHRRDSGDLDAGGGVTDGMEAVGSPA
jgi:hypothetical protein